MSSKITIEIDVTPEGITQAKNAWDMVAAMVESGDVPGVEHIPAPTPADGAPVETPAPDNVTPLHPDPAVFNTPPAGETPPPPPPAGDTPPPPPALAEVDSEGLPWDARIHSKNRGVLAKTKAWKKKRGVAIDEIQAVEAELKAVQMSAAVNTTPPPPATNTTPPPPAGIENFPQLMSAITAAKITPEAAAEACKKCGVDALPLLAANPDQIPAVAAALGL